MLRNLHKYRKLLDLRHWLGEARFANRGATATECVGTATARQAEIRNWAPRRDGSNERQCSTNCVGL